MDIYDASISLNENMHLKKNITKEHSHEIHQILYVLENEGCLRLAGKSSTINSSKIVLIQPNTVHSVKSNGKMTTITLQFHPSKLNSLSMQLIHHYLYESSIYQLNQWEIGEVRQLLRKMLYEQSIGDKLNMLAIHIHLSELLLILAKQNKVLSFSDANELRAHRIKHFIDTRYFEKIDTMTLSQKIEVSTRYMHEIFKEYFNTTPLVYLQKVRIEKAKELLKQSDKEVTTICFEVGFESLSTFYRQFKDLTNVSPNQYRLRQKL